MLNNVTEKAINDQINNEFYSAYMYLALSQHFDRMSLTGFAHWLRMQSQEELAHALKLVDFLCSQDGTLVLREIEAPPHEFDTPVAAITMAREQEQDNTEQINDIYDLAVKHADHATQVFMQWFIMEQVEEEKSARTILERLKLAGNDRAALLVLDQELRQRAAAPAK